MNRTASHSIPAGGFSSPTEVNARIQIFDQDGKFLAEWKQFGRPSAVFIDKNDVIYVANSQTEDKDGCTPDPGCRRGIRIGSAKDGTVTAFIPRPNPAEDKSGGEGVAADAVGDVFGAEDAARVFVNTRRTNRRRISLQPGPTQHQPGVIPAVI